MTGRPCIDDDKVFDLMACFVRGVGPSAAARRVGVHRNTASNYYEVFKDADFEPRVAVGETGDGK